METNNDTPITDADRRLAEAKKLILSPLHANITPEPIPDGEAVARHANGPAIANISTDTEGDDTALQPTRSMTDHPPHTDTEGSGKYLIGVAIAAVIAGGISFYLLTK